MREVAITAVGRDRPGIVAGLTEALRDLGANLADCRAALLRGSFAIVVSVAVPDSVDDDELRRAVEGVAADLDLGVWVGPASPPTEGSGGGACTVSVYGADHPGIVAAVSRAVAEHGANIVDLSSRLVGEPPLYVLGLRVELPSGLDAPGLAAALEPVARAQGVECAVESDDDEVM